MKRFITCLVLSLMSFGISCKNGQQKQVVKEPPLQIKKDSLAANITNPASTSQIDPYDSLANVKINTKTLKGKREYIMNHFLLENGASGAHYDSLFDVNYDGHKDYVIGYYGASGTGLKNRVNIYLYSAKKNNYVLDEQLSQLPNPSFYINRKKITSFYLGNGAGGGGELKWINNKWVEVMHFDADHHTANNDSCELIISYPLKKKSKKYLRPYFMIPPQNILENKWGNYPPF